MFAERKMLAQEQMGRNWKINLGKNLESEEKPSITSPLVSETFYRGRRQTGVRDSTGRGGEEKKRKQRF